MPDSAAPATLLSAEPPLLPTITSAGTAVFAAVLGLASHGLAGPGVLAFGAGSGHNSCSMAPSEASSDMGTMPEASPGAIGTARGDVATVESGGSGGDRYSASRAP